MERKNLIDSLTIGFALFAMFFGAGNLIFPPFLGWQSGSSWLIGFLCFIFIDIGMGLFAMLVIAKNGHGAEGIGEKLGTKISFLLMAAMSLCLGPFVAIPRTASITYEIGVLPNFEEVSSWVCTAVFFLISCMLSIKQSRVIDIVGKILAPVMFAALLVMILKNFLTPIGSIGESAPVSDVVRNGLLSGYQTMDMMAACIFSVALLLAIKQKGYTTKKQQFSLIAGGGVIATVLLFIVYGGLAYIGAAASCSVTQEMSQPQLLILLTEALMGRGGLILLGMIVSFACLTTAIGLLTSISTYFAEKLPIPYEVFVVTFSLASWIISNFGTVKIIAMAAPVLDLIYPVLIVLIVFGLLSDRIKSVSTYRFAAFGAFAASLLLQAESLLGIDILTERLPFSGLGFGWILPAAVFAVIGAWHGKYTTV